MEVGSKLEDEATSHPASNEHSNEDSTRDVKEVFRKVDEAIVVSASLEKTPANAEGEVEDVSAGEAPAGDRAALATVPRDFQGGTQGGSFATTSHSGTSPRTSEGLTNNLAAAEEESVEGSSPAVIQGTKGDVAPNGLGPKGAAEKEGPECAAAPAKGRPKDVTGDEKEGAERVADAGHKEGAKGGAEETLVWGRTEKAPVVESEAAQVAEGVTKQVIKEGTGDLPPANATCFVNYRAWVADSESKFHDTWEEHQVKELVIGQEDAPFKGLVRGVASMRRGERALLRCGWELGYGEEGSFSFPHVPPKADLVYEAELVGFEPMKEGKKRADMTVEERIEAADRHRLAGNELFKKAEYEEAVSSYEMALSFMGDEFMFQLFGKYKESADAVRIPCLLNTAACMLKLERWTAVIENCTQVLVEDEKNPKALFRRGKARQMLGQTDAAKEDLLKARKVAPGDTQVIKELRSIAEHEKELLEEQRKLFKGMFKPQPDEGEEAEKRGPRKGENQGEGGGLHRKLFKFLGAFLGAFRIIWPFGRR